MVNFGELKIISGRALNSLLRGNKLVVNTLKCIYGMHCFYGINLFLLGSDMSGKGNRISTWAWTMWESISMHAPRLYICSLDISTLLCAGMDFKLVIFIQVCAVGVKRTFSSYFTPEELFHSRSLRSIPQDRRTIFQ